ncbi:MAG: DMT family transporter [Lachnospiraceae bacterium]|nr:DMT family transporter [Lachnospiraceae bacterium]
MEKQMNSCQEERERRFYTNKGNFYLLIFVLYFLWAVCVPLTKMGYEGFHIGTDDVFEMISFAGVRLFLGGALGLAFCRIKGMSVFPGSAAEFWQIVKLSLIMSVLQYIFLYVGTANTQGVVASILASSGAFLGILFSSLVFREDKMTIRKMAGCILGMLAVIILNIHDVRSGMVFSLFGSLMIIAAEAAGTLGAVYLKYISQGKNAVYIGCMQTFLGGVLLLLLGTLGGGSLHMESGVPQKAIGSTVAIILSTAVTLVISNQMYKYNSISKVVIFTLLLPVFGTLTSGLLLKESLASVPLLVSLLINCIGIGLVTIEKNSK